MRHSAAGTAPGTRVVSRTGQAGPWGRRWRPIRLSRRSAELPVYVGECVGQCECFCVSGAGEGREEAAEGCDTGSVVED